MSNFWKNMINPKTGRIEKAQFVDDYYGKHQYAVMFTDENGKETYYPESKVKRPPEVEGREDE